jgi:hypothetical protein
LARPSRQPTARRIIEGGGEPEDLHPDSDTGPAPDEELPVEQLVSRIKTSRATTDLTDAAQQLIEQSRRRRDNS